jgi:hypothetical protein
LGRAGEGEFMVIEKLKIKFLLSKSIFPILKMWIRLGFPFDKPIIWKR